MPEAWLVARGEMPKALDATCMSAHGFDSNR